MKKSIVATAFTAIFATGTAQAILIDNFDGGAQSVVAPGSNTVAYAGAIGSFRTIDITKAGPLGASAGIITPPGIYSHSADTLTSATSTIVWDASGAGLGGVDLVGSLVNNVFNFDILSIDQGSIDLVFSVSDTLGGTDLFTFSNAGVGTQSVAFSNFSGVDFTSIDSMSLQVIGGIASDLTLDLLETTGDPPPLANVPEPAPLALLAAGLVAFGFRRKAK